MRSVPGITFEIRPSRLLAVTMAGMALLAVVAVLVCDLPLWLRVPVAIGVTGYAAIAWCRLRRSPLLAVGWHGDDTWTLRLADGTDAEGQLRSGRVLGPLIVLRLSWAPRGATALALLPDNLDADTRRRLRMRLSALSDNG